MSRPKIAIVGRLTETAAAIRYSGVVSSRRLLESVWNAGGDPITFLPVANPDWKTRLEGISGVLLAGGGDINPIWYGQEPETDQLYGIDDLQDENDFSIAKYALDSGIPVLAICRGCQIVNVLKGGSLVQHMDKDHRHHVHTVHLDRDVAELGLTKPDLEASCFHHQAIDKLGDDLEVIARAQEGHIEAFKINAKVWSYGFQWHPEDNSTTVDQQHELFVRFVSEAAKN